MNQALYAHMNNKRKKIVFQKKKNETIRVRVDNSLSIMGTAAN
jgi:hypothetical protein